MKIKKNDLFETNEKKIQIPLVLELIARGGHGKDTSLNILNEILGKNFKIEKEYMAFYMKDFIRKIFDINSENKFNTFYKKNNKWYDKDNNFISEDLLDILKDIPFPYENKKFNFKSKFTMREILQKVGTEFFRSEIDNDFHVKILLQKIFKKNDEKVLNVFTDIRFKNEKDVFLSIGNEKNIQQLYSLSNSIHINLTINEMYDKLLKIVLGVSPEEISPDFEKKIKKELAKVKQLNCDNNNYLSLEQLNLDFDEKNSKTKVLRIFRPIQPKDEEQQRKLYAEHKIDFNKEKEKVGYLREGILPHHPSESSLRLTKSYKEYSPDELIYANSLEELREKLEKYVEKNFNFLKNNNLTHNNELKI